MFRFFTFVFAILAIAVGAQAADQLYTCGMHPQIIKHEPGNCPICGMKLTPIKSTAALSPVAASGPRKIKYYKSTMTPGEVKPGPGKDSMGMDMVPVYEDEDSSSANNIQIDAATVQRMNLRTALVERGPVRRQFRTVGTIAYNEQGLRDITTKYEGWLEKLYVNATWTVVKAGDPLFEIYSPDLYNAELNYIVALKGEGETGGPLTRAALARLQLFDIPKEVIAEITQAKEPRRTFLFRAPADGVVIEKMAVVGQMMKPGEQIYRMADLSSVWVQAEIYEKDLPYVHPGEVAIVRTSYGPTRTFEGKVELVVPQVQEQTRTATARIVLSNPELFLRPGMYVDVQFSATLREDAVLVPDMAVLRSGERNTVFLALDGGFFAPREVKLGARSEGDTYEVLSGLKAGERVVTSGQFMLDSESQLREAIQKMLKPASSTPTAAPEAAPAAAPAENMPQHSAMAPSALQPVALAMADAAAALAKDDLSGYNSELPVLSSALTSYFSADEHAAHGPLAKFRAGVAAAPDLQAARAAFGPMSTAVADLVLTAPTAGLHVFECSMVKARWVQREPGTKNPFNGEKMLECGEELKVRPTASVRQAPPLDPAALAGKLPPGHPPISGNRNMSLKEFADSQRGIDSSVASAESSGEACGSCGMTAEQMAAGEPCEHGAATKQ